LKRDSCDDNSNSENTTGESYSSDNINDSANASKDSSDTDSGYEYHSSDGQRGGSDGSDNPEYEIVVKSETNRTSDNRSAGDDEESGSSLNNQNSNNAGSESKQNTAENNDNNTCLKRASCSDGESSSDSDGRVEGSMPEFDDVSGGSSDSEGQVEGPRPGPGDPVYDANYRDGARAAAEDVRNGRIYQTGYDTNRVEDPGYDSGYDKGWVRSGGEYVH
jgi:hypothetical protein